MNLAGSNIRPDLFMDGSVTRSLDIQLPDEIIAIMGRELKIDYLGKRHCIMVSKKMTRSIPVRKLNVIPITLSEFLIR